MTVSIHAGSHTYPIIIQRGALAFAADVFPRDKHAFILTDEGVPASYPQAIADAFSKSKTFVLTVGEQNKSPETLLMLWRTMLDTGFDRNCCVVAVGGGVIGDLAGLLAATYMRGVDFYNVPTTLLAQVDASVGGKCAVDLDGIKNAVGAFYPPKAVLIDPDVLDTLETRQFSAGMAEIIKMAVTLDEPLFQMIEAGVNRDNLPQIIARTISRKAQIVEQDEREYGLRRVLNFGHTFGHAIESHTDLLHGECIAVGMLPMAAPAVRARLLPLLQTFGLPTSCALEASSLLSAIEHDKKRHGDTVTAVFAPGVGSYEFRDIPLTELEKIWSDFTE